MWLWLFYGLCGVGWVPYLLSVPPAFLACESLHASSPMRPVATVRQRVTKFIFHDFASGVIPRRYIYLTPDSLIPPLILPLSFVCPVIIFYGSLLSPLAYCDSRHLNDFLRFYHAFFFPLPDALDMPCHETSSFFISRRAFLERCCPNPERLLLITIPLILTSKRGPWRTDVGPTCMLVLLLRP